MCIVYRIAGPYNMQTEHMNGMKNLSPTINTASLVKVHYNHSKNGSIKRVIVKRCTPIVYHSFDGKSQENAEKAPEKFQY